MHLWYIGVGIPLGCHISILCLPLKLNLRIALDWSFFFTRVADNAILIELFARGGGGPNVGPVI